MRRAATALVALLFAFGCAEDRRPMELRQSLALLRTAIAKFTQDKGRGPHTLQELVPEYIATIPKDPFGTQWVLVTEEPVMASADFTATNQEAPKPTILDVKSGAPGTDASGVRYAEY